MSVCGGPIDYQGLVPLSSEADALQRFPPHPNIIACRGRFRSPISAALRRLLPESVATHIADETVLHYEVFDFHPSSATDLLQFATQREGAPVGRSEGWLLPRKLFAKLARGVCSAFTHMAAHGVVHRDVRLSHVDIASDGEAVLRGFGRAVVLAAEGDSAFQLAMHPGVSAQGDEVGV